MKKKKNQKNLRVQLRDSLKDRWDEMLDRKKMSQQDAVERLVEFILEQEDTIQSVILQQFTPPFDVIEYLLRRMQSPKHALERSKLLLDEPKRQNQVDRR
jgi:hypothetical protein